MIIAMGLIKQENIQYYWSTHEILSTPFSFKLCWDKFMDIFHLCVKENNVPHGQEGYNPVNKHYI